MQGNKPLISVQWLIDLLIEFQRLDTYTQIGIAFAIVAVLLMIGAWIKGAFRRDTVELDDENEKLAAKATLAKTILNSIRRENQDLQSKIDALEARLPKTVLERVDRQIDDGNYEIAIRELEAMVDDLSPGLAGCFSSMVDLATAPPADGVDTEDSEEVERWRQLSDLLRAKAEKASPS